MDLSKIPFDDKATFDLISSGNNHGLFQLNEGWLRGILRKIAPTTLEEVAAINALIRPGSTDSSSHNEYATRKKSGNRQPTIHPELNEVLYPILKETYGLIVYQEQVLQVLKAVTGWGYAEADLVFNAMRKKDLAKMEAAKPALFDASRSLGFSSDAMETLWTVLAPFADYSFNKAHAMGYGVVTYYTGYLKANYPVEFMTALLTTDIDSGATKKGQDSKLEASLKETQRLGIELLPPDINTSGQGFTRDGKVIRYGLEAIKGLSTGVLPHILKGRPYRSLDDFFRRVSTKVLNTGVLTAIVCSGGMDSLYPERERLFGELSGISELAIEHRRSSSDGQALGLRPSYRPRGPGSVDLRLRQDWEGKYLGTVLSQPEVHLRSTKALSDTEAAWLSKLLKPGAQKTYLDGAYLGRYDSVSGLATTLATIGIEVN